MGRTAFALGCRGKEKQWPKFLQKTESYSDHLPTLVNMLDFHSIILYLEEASSWLFQFPDLEQDERPPGGDYWLCKMNFFNMWTNCQIESHWRMVVVAFNNCRTTEAERNDCWSGVSNRNENYISICLLELSSPLIST
jgi:hypothetical protein